MGPEFEQVEVGATLKEQVEHLTQKLQVQRQKVSAAQVISFSFSNFLSFFPSKTAYHPQTTYRKSLALKPDICRFLAPEESITT